MKQTALISGGAAVAVLAGLWFFSTSPGSHRLVYLLESSYPPVAAESCPQGDAIAVLAGTGPPRNHPLRSFETPNRMDGALALYRANRAPDLVLTTKEGEANRLEAMERGVPPDRIWLAGEAANTVAEARAIKDLAIRRNWHTLLLVTSSFHMRRAVLLVNRAAASSGYRLAVVPFPVDWQQIPAVPRGRSRWMPNRYGIELFKRTLKEIGGIIVYSL